MKRLLLMLSAISTVHCTIAAGQTETPDSLVKQVPPDFTQFEFSGHAKESQLLSHYMWYHYKSRLGHLPTLFPQEYLTTADMWLSRTPNPVWGEGKSIQQKHREQILGMKIDEEGYILTNQHFSHCHEKAWPFPLWIQGYKGPDEAGAAGFHFNYEGIGWMWDMFLKHQPDSRFARDNAIKGWGTENIQSEGIVSNCWKLVSTATSPSIESPSDVLIDAFNAPYLQLRWNRSKPAPIGVLPYVEWKRAGDSDYSTDRRVYFDFNTGNPDYEQATGMTHSMITMYKHPEWNGTIEAIRISLAPGESNIDFEIDSFFTVYDTRQTLNNPTYIFTCWNYFKWSGDINFLRQRINQMRQSLRFQQVVLGGLEYNHIHNTMPGHDGIAGLTWTSETEKKANNGHGIGSNYWDILAFGWDDMYATSQYYASLLVMAQAEEMVAANPGWDVAKGYDAFDPKILRKHAAKVKQVANKKFWNKEKGRFYGTIDKNGETHDYGFTFMNLESIWYGIASDKHAESIMSWINGDRIIESDTSTGDDIYAFRFGPRATTLRNLDWYQFIWTGPETIPWGGQVQDGGAVLGFTFFDLWARLKVLGADNAWQRFTKIMKWEEEVWKAGGYREFYKDGSQGTTLQGGGTAGGIGIDAEFFESSLMPSIITYGFMGIDPQGQSLKIAPKLPADCPEMTIRKMQYHNVLMDIRCNNDSVSLALRDEPVEPIVVVFDEIYKNSSTDELGNRFEFQKTGTYKFIRN